MEKRRGHVRNASNWSTTSAVRKRTTTYNEKRDYHSVLQKFGESQIIFQIIIRSCKSLVGDLKI